MDKIENTSSKSFWNDLYLSNDISWDLKGPAQPLLHWLKENSVKGEKICIPGCGNGYDALEFAANGAQVWAVDFAEEPIYFLEKRAKEINQIVNTICGDLFALSNSHSEFFSMVWEYTCYCAIDPERRQDYRDLIYQILAKGGKFISLFFPILKQEEEGGPAFGVNLGSTLEMFNEKFDILEINAKPNSIMPRIGNEVLVKMVKRG